MHQVKNCLGHAWSLIRPDDHFAHSAEYMGPINDVKECTNDVKECRGISPLPYIYVCTNIFLRAILL